MVTCSLGARERPMTGWSMLQKPTPCARSQSKTSGWFHELCRTSTTSGYSMNCMKSPLMYS